MLKKTTLASILIIGSLLFSSVAFADDVDFEIADISHYSCYEEAELLDSPYSYYAEELSIDDDGTEKFFVGDVMHEFVHQFMLGEDEATGEYGDVVYSLIEMADDHSWYRFVVDNPSVDNKSIVTVACYKITVDAEGEIGEFDDHNETVNSMEEFFEFLNTRLGFSVQLLASDITKYANKEIIGSMSYITDGKGTWEVPQSVLDNGGAEYYGSMWIVETGFDPEEDMQLVTVVNNTFDYGTKMFYRTWFDDTVTHYNEGPTVVEGNMDNNYGTFDFWTTGDDYLSAPEITDVVYEEGFLIIEWSAVEGTDTYFVTHVKDDLNKVEWDMWQNTVYTDELTYSVEAGDDENFMECFDVVAVDEDGIAGPPSAQICTGGYFNDVPETEWYSQYANKAANQNYLSGYSDADGNPLGLFGPDDEITKAEALKIISEISGRYVRANMFGYELPYDVPNDYEEHWAWKYIWGTHIVGIDLVVDEDFNPDEVITRGEMMHLVADSLEPSIPNYDEYSFSDTDDYVYADDIEFFKELGVVSGYGGTDEFGPNNSLLRAEAAKIFVEVADSFIMSWPGQDMLN